MTARDAPAVEVVRDGSVVAVIRHADPDAALVMASSCLDAGLRTIEVTLTTPRAFELIAELTSVSNEHAIVGAGTVLGAEQAEAAVDAGARFLVSPVLGEEVLAVGRRRGVGAIPGTFTPTEVRAAVALGATTVKLYPAGCVGPSFVGAISSVLPEVRLLPTGGIEEVDVAAWLAAGAAAVGVGSALNRAFDLGGGPAVGALAARLISHEDPERLAHHQRQ